MHTRFVLKDGPVEIHECTSREGRARVIVNDGRLERVAHYTTGISDGDAIAAVDDFRARQYADFLKWAARNNFAFDSAEYPAPQSIG